MTQNCPPYPPFPHGNFAPPPRRRAGDVIGSVALALTLVPACAFGLIYSMFAGMSTEGCSGATRCSDGMVNAAYLVSWGGIAGALLTTLLGIIISARRRSTIVLWPALGWAIFLITFIAGGLLLHAGVSGW